MSISYLTERFYLLNSTRQYALGFRCMYEHMLFLVLPHISVKKYKENDSNYNIREKKMVCLFCAIYVCVYIYMTPTKRKKVRNMTAIRCKIILLHFPLPDHSQIRRAIHLTQINAHHHLILSHTIRVPASLLPDPHPLSRYLRPRHSWALPRRIPYRTSPILSLRSIREIVRPRTEECARTLEASDREIRMIASIFVVMVSRGSVIL